jgi:hypothetical protein
MTASETSEYSFHSRRAFCFAASSGAGPGGEAGSGGAGAPPDADGRPADGAPAAGSEEESELEDEPLRDLLQRMCGADEAAAGEAAAALVLRGAADEGRCDAIAAAADTSQLLRLLRFTLDGGMKYSEEEYEDADDFFQEQDALACALLRSLAARSAGDRAVCEAVAAAPDMIPLLMGQLKDFVSGDEAAAALAALAEFGGERCRAALFATGRPKTLVRSLGGDTQEASCAARVLGALAAAGSDAERDALLAAGAAPLLVEQLSGRMFERPRATAALAVLGSISALRHLATTTERARGRVAEVRAAGGVGALISQLDEALDCCSWWMDWRGDIASAAEAALLALGEEHRRSGADGPLLSAEDTKALRGMVAGESRWIPVETEGGKRDGEGEEGEEESEEEGFPEDNEERAAVAARLLERLA